MMHLSSAAVPILGSPARVLGMTLIVVVQCDQCDGHDELALVNAQPAVCPTCGALVSLERIQWSKDSVPKIELQASRPLGRA